MKKNEDGSWGLTDAELLLKEWHNSLLDTGYSHGGAAEQILLRTPTDGVAWKLLTDMDFRTHLAGIRFWGPLAKDDHVVTNEPLPRIEFLDDEGNRKSEAGVRRLGPDLYVVKDPDCDIEHLMTTQEIKDDDYVRFVPERHDCQPADLEFQGEVGAPGFGQAWECKECHAPWGRVGEHFFRHDENAPQELSINDVI